MLTVLQTFIIVKFIRDVQVPDSQCSSPEASTGLSEQDVKVAVASAVGEAVEVAFRNTVGRATVPGSDRADTRLSRGAQFTGNVLALQGGTRQAY